MHFYCKGKVENCWNVARLIELHFHVLQIQTTQIVSKQIKLHTNTAQDFKKIACEPSQYH
jgi:hypothetical protein